MRYSISTCSFYKFRIRRLLEIGEPFGVEIFYEFGSEDHWRSLLTQVAQQTRGPFSIHAPFAFADVAAPEEGQLFEIMRRPFDLYHAFGGEFYVVHSYGETVRPGDETYRRDCRARAADRLARLQDICAAEGVTLAVENLCSGDRPLFDEEQFLALFRDLPDIKCVIDVGHALVAKMDVTRLQQALGGRICGYHLHETTVNTTATDGWGTGSWTGSPSPGAARRTRRRRWACSSTWTAPTWLPTGRIWTI